MKTNLHRLILLLFFGLISHVSGVPNVAKPKPQHRLRVGDELQLSVFQEPGLSKLLIIDREGKVLVPKIKKAISLFGLTREEAAEMIRSAYADGFLKYPQVDLKITKIFREFVEVSGQVMKAGPVEIPIRGNLDLFTALTRAGGVTVFANTDAIKLKPLVGANETFTLAEVQGEKGKRLLKSGDQIMVGKNRVADTAVSVEGRVAKPGLVLIPKGGNLDLASAIVGAGGLAPDADPSRIELISTDGGKSSLFSDAAILRGSAGKILLEGGDRVLIRQSPFVGLGITVKGAVSKREFMPFPLNGKLTLKAALTGAGLSDLARKKKVEVTRGGKTMRFNMKATKSEVWLQPGDAIRVQK